MSTKTRKPLNLPRTDNYEFSPEGFSKRRIAKNLDAERFVMSDDLSEKRIIINGFLIIYLELRYDRIIYCTIKTNFKYGKKLIIKKIKLIIVVLEKLVA